MICNDFDILVIFINWYEISILTVTNKCWITVIHIESIMPNPEPTASIKVKPNPSLVEADTNKS